MNKSDTEPKTNCHQMQIGGHRIHLTFTRHCLQRQCKVHEAGQVHATGQNEDEVTSVENEDETTGGEN
jgi:hypothetical protein